MEGGGDTSIWPGYAGVGVSAALCAVTSRPCRTSRTPGQNLRAVPIRSVWAGTPARARRRRATAAAVTGRPTGCLASLPSMTSLSWLPAIKWTCYPFADRRERGKGLPTMVDLRSCPFCGGNEMVVRPSALRRGWSIDAFTHSAEDVSHRLRQSGQRSWAQSKTGIGEPTMVKNLNHRNRRVFVLAMHKNRIKTHFAQILVSGTSEKLVLQIFCISDPTDRKYHIGARLVLPRLCV